MRLTRVIVGLLLLNGWLVVPHGNAQQKPGAVSRGRSGGADAPPDGELRAYGTRNGAVFALERRDNARPYVKQPPPTPAETRARAAVFSQSRSYYPALRKGQSPNQNVVDPRTLCVPGRRAMLQVQR